MANIHLSYEEFKAIYGDLGLTEWVKYNWLSDYTPGPVTEGYEVSIDQPVPLYIVITGTGIYQENDEVTITITCDDNHYWGPSNSPTVDGNAMTQSGDSFIYTFTMPAEDVALSIGGVDTVNKPVLSIDPQYIGVVYTGLGGHVPGESVTVTMSPDTDYHWGENNAPYLDGNAMTQSGNVFSYTLTMPNVDTTLVSTGVDIEEDATYSVTVAVSAQNVDVTGANSYHAGETVVISITPSSGYQWGALNAPVADSTPMTQSGNSFTYTFTMPASTTTITITGVVTELIPVTGYQFAYAANGELNEQHSGYFHDSAQDNNYFYLSALGASGGIYRFSKNVNDNTCTLLTFTGDYGIGEIGGLAYNSSFSINGSNHPVLCTCYGSYAMILDLTTQIAYEVSGLTTSYAAYAGPTGEFRTCAGYGTGHRGPNIACIQGDNSLVPYHTLIDVTNADPDLASCEILGMYYDSNKAAYDGWSYLMFDSNTNECFWYGAYTSPRYSMLNESFSRKWFVKPFTGYGVSNRIIAYDGWRGGDHCWIFTIDSSTSTITWDTSIGYPQMTSGIVAPFQVGNYSQYFYGGIRQTSSLYAGDDLTSWTSYYPLIGQPRTIICDSNKMIVGDNNTGWCIFIKQLVS